MNINDLKKIGGIITDPPVQKHITWTMLDDEGEAHDYEADIFVRKLTAGDWDRIFNEPNETDHQRNAIFVQVGVRLGDGTEQLTYDDAYDLHTNLLREMAQAVNEVNGKAKKKSRKKTNSGITSLPQESADAA